MLFIAHSASENIFVAIHKLLMERFFGRVLAVEFLDQRVHVFKNLIDIGKLSSRKAALIFILSTVYVDSFFPPIFFILKRILDFGSDKNRQRGESLLKISDDLEN